MNEITNRVSASALITIDLGDYYPKEPIEILDIKPWLHMGLMLKEKDFRENIATHNWHLYNGKIVGIICSADAIIPVWGYMLIASKLSGVASYFIFGNKNELISSYMQEKLNTITPLDYKDKRIVIKGCGDFEVPPSAFVHLMQRLQPYTKSIMYGEPCSTVPVWKKSSSD